MSKTKPLLATLQESENLWLSLINSSKRRAKNESIGAYFFNFYSIPAEEIKNHSVFVQLQSEFDTLKGEFEVLKAELLSKCVEYDKLANKFQATAKRLEAADKELDEAQYSLAGSADVESSLGSV